jgi:LemA protein
MRSKPAKISAGLVILLGAVVLIALWLFSSYNSLVSQREGVDGQWAQVETQYQRRFDLIPALVNTVQGAADFEKSTLTAVTEARTKWMDNAGDRDGRVQAANEFDSALARLLVTVEAYPQLKATQAFQDFMTQLEGTENRISNERRVYNDTVRDYNVTVKRFPTVIFASIFGFDPAEFFDATEGSDLAPAVDFE